MRARPVARGPLSSDGGAVHGDNRAIVGNVNFRTQENHLMTMLSSLDLIRRVLKNLRGSRVECLGRGQNAQWRKLGNG